MVAPTLPPEDPKDQPPPRDDYDRFVDQVLGAVEKAGDWIGPYKLLEVIGEGGFGVVWLAERREPMVQRVALKVIKPGMDSKAVIARFEQERQALAVMDHPNVAKVFDGGVTPTGRPYFVMEHVQGEAISVFCDRHNYTIRQRLELFVPVCEAVQHAHHKGIIHRDIKPSNILVTIKDGRPIPKVIDFGVAKAISHTLTEKTIFTETGHLVGTPEYMSPEQAEMGALDVDSRTDIYSLGVLLYELLVGELPLDSATLRTKGYAEIQRVIREMEPLTPSRRLTSVARERVDEIVLRRQTDLGALARELRRDLEWIPITAMRKDRARRYSTAAMMAEDVNRYVKGLPLSVRPDSVGYRLRKAFRRYRRAIAVSAVLVIAVLWVAGYLIRQHEDKRRAQEEMLLTAKFMSVLVKLMPTDGPRRHELAYIIKATEAMQPQLVNTVSRFAVTPEMNRELDRFGASVDADRALIDRLLREVSDPESPGQAVERLRRDKRMTPALRPIMGLAVSQRQAGMYAASLEKLVLGVLCDPESSTAQIESVRPAILVLEAHLYDPEGDNLIRVSSPLDALQKLRAGDASGAVTAVESIRQQQDQDPQVHDGWTTLDLFLLSGCRGLALSQLGKRDAAAVELRTALEQLDKLDPRTRGLVRHLEERIGAVAESQTPGS